MQIRVSLSQIVAYDLETEVRDDRSLVSTLAVVKCGVEIHSFWCDQEKTASDYLLKFLIERSNSFDNRVKIVALGHNGSRFDSYEILRSMLRYSFKPKICSVNQKIVDLALPQFNLHFRDSYLFLPVWYISALHTMLELLWSWSGRDLFSTQNM